MWSSLLRATEQSLQARLSIGRKDGQVALGRACLLGDAGLTCRNNVSVCLFAQPLKSLAGWAHVAFEAHFAPDGYFMDVDNVVIVLR